MLSYFTDAVLRAPTIGSMLMCLAAALIGVIVLLRKQSLIGESLSHAAYPGVVLGVIAAGSLGFSENDYSPIALLIMTGAFFSALLGLFAINSLMKHLKVRSDSALCFVLAVFFGVGITMASHVQFTYSSLYRQIQSYLYGQAATMTDIHIAIYGVLSFSIICTIALFYKELQAITFDREYAKSLGINVQPIDQLVFILTALAIVIGIRSVGVVLMSAMLIAPAAAARQFTNRLSTMFGLAALFGLLSGYFGNYFSVELNQYLAGRYPSERLIIPTGPMIVMTASVFCLLSLMFAPNRGWLLRLIRIGRFRYQCICENLLKAIWRINPHGSVNFYAIEKYQSLSPLYLRFLLSRLVRNGWLEKTVPDGYRLTKEGSLWAAKIVRLHRLWEVYLANYVGVRAERVHRNAEEMEHIITPQLERELTLLLKDPKQDPHHQPIPREGETL